MVAKRWSYLRLNVEDEIPLAAIASDSDISRRTALDAV
ncbi:hypothetical protein J2S98_004040 [Arthrobacter oryzae]|nr:hypothetical protein [Arthrobacter oryzae]